MHTCEYLGSEELESQTKAMRESRLLHEIIRGIAPRVLNTTTLFTLWLIVDPESTSFDRAPVCFS